MKTFSARETVWQQRLDGLELAGFGRRACAFLIDWALVGVLLAVVFTTGAMAYLGATHQLHSGGIHLLDREDRHEPLDTLHKLAQDAVEILADIVLPVLYFGLLLWQGNGRTPGKRMMKIRVVSIVHTHMSFWHSVERALGYGAAALEGGFGFVQYFIHPYRRCAQDRLAETIVVTERSYRQFFPEHA